SDPAAPPGPATPDRRRTAHSPPDPPDTHRPYAAYPNSPLPRQQPRRTNATRPDQLRATRPRHPRRQPQRPRKDHHRALPTRARPPGSLGVRVAAGHGPNEVV